MQNNFSTNASPYPETFSCVTPSIPPNIGSVLVNAAGNLHIVLFYYATNFVGAETIDISGTVSISVFIIKFKWSNFL